MRIVRYTLLLCFMSLGWANLKAQTPIPCATPPVKSTWLTQFQQRSNQSQLRSTGTKYVAMTIHIVGTDEGKDYINSHQILDALCMLNEKYNSTGLQFFIKGNFHYINNSILFEHDKTTFPQIPNLFARYNVSETVNVYFVRDPMDACGYNYMPGGNSMAIVLSNDCTNGRDANWAHEMGHYLSLPHTFYGWEMEIPNFSSPAPHETQMGVEVEMANGSNCSLAGDGFCDTPADYLSGRWQCDSKGISIIKQMDPDGNYFCSDGSLIMSYSLDACANRFSTSQVDAMHSYLGENLSHYFMTTAPCNKIEPIADDVLEYPANKVVVNALNKKVFFQWHEVENATGYLLEVSLFANFATTVYRGITRDTNLEVSNLTSTRYYYWRIRPFNAMYACKSYSAARSFTVNQTTAAPLLESVRELALYPNPSLPGETLRLRFDADENMHLQAILVNTLGAVVHQQNIQTTVGNNEYLLQPQVLPAGMYHLWLKGEKGAISKKLVIH